MIIVQIFYGPRLGLEHAGSRNEKGGKLVLDAECLCASTLVCARTQRSDALNEVHNHRHCKVEVCRFTLAERTEWRNLGVLLSQGKQF
jgi:hypothetical protein